MLVLSRKTGERIVVPQCGLSVTVIAIKGKTVRLAIAAPAEVDVFREEIWHQVRQQTPCPPAKEEGIAAGSSPDRAVRQMPLTEDVGSFPRSLA